MSQTTSPGDSAATTIDLCSLLAQAGQAINDLMPGIGKLALSGEQIARINAVGSALARRAYNPSAATPRAARQRQFADWCETAFGRDEATSLPQRGVRLAEEAIEAAQAAGTSREMLHRLVDHVYDHAPGALHQELGGVGVTLLALAAAAKLDADTEEARELARVLAKPLAHFTARNKRKNAAGFNATMSPPAMPANTRSRRAARPRRAASSFCSACSRDRKAPLFDGCMHPHCPHGLEPCL